MIVDTSAIMAVLLDEPEASDITRKMASSICRMSAATRVELGIVVESKAGAEGVQLLDELLDRLEVEIVPFDADQANDALVGWRRFGKGRHPAGLNLGDAFSYALAVRLREPLSFVGDDFSHTDVAVA